MNSTSVSDAFLRLLRFTPYPSRLTIRVNNFPPHLRGRLAVWLLEIRA